MLTGLYVIQKLQKIGFSLSKNAQHFATGSASKKKKKEF
jgi:hypothetical protein